MFSIEWCADRNTEISSPKVKKITLRDLRSEIGSDFMSGPESLKESLLRFS